MQNEITRQRNLDEVKKCSHAGNSEWMTAIKAEVRAGQQTILKSLFGHDHLKNIFLKAQVVSFYWYFIKLKDVGVQNWTIILRIWYIYFVLNTFLSTFYISCVWSVYHITSVEKRTFLFPSKYPFEQNEHMSVIVLCKRIWTIFDSTNLLFLI